MNRATYPPVKPKIEKNNRSANPVTTPGIISGDRKNVINNSRPKNSYLSMMTAAETPRKVDARAEQVYRDELSSHPHNGWSLHGLRQALEAQGKSDPDVDADFEESWSRSDVWIVASRF